MKGIPNTERQRLGALLDHETQETVMAMIPQFSETEIGAPVPAPAEVPEELGLLVFNMERGVHLEELGDFLQDCPGVRPLDVVLANELDDGCVRSGGRNTARELAERFGWELRLRPGVHRAGEWGGPQGLPRKCGVLPLAHPAGVDRAAAGAVQLVLRPPAPDWRAMRGDGGAGCGRSASGRGLHPPGEPHPWRGTAAPAGGGAPCGGETASRIPVVLGGDLNTNTFDGRDKDAIREDRGESGTPAPLSGRRGAV